MKLMINFNSEDAGFENSNFKVVFLEEAFVFLNGLPVKHAEKILQGIRKSQLGNDPVFFKKIDSDIWEFRTRYQGLQYRLLAFWDKRDMNNTLVIATHGFIKKQSKVPDSQIKRAIAIRLFYFKN
ncbi:MAG TPA: type II toxin-antitoxin system RelE/ParE family toxin [Sediminibacterium sp.]|jgi:phage-related protein|nr:type II toxin-antitoxin system RelE/ParE family toxin [Sediminibacterium sp.]HQS53998.1 type II toxin-antitoxin system RelE/ParE family toxin [Sediminibacterium sp.]